MKANILFKAGLTAAAAILFSCSDNPAASKGPAYHAVIEKDRWGLIDNVYSKEAGIHNTNALNLAMRTLLEEGHTKLRLEKGDYCVWGSYADDTPENHVSIPSNVELDLNGSTLRLAKNDRPHSRVIRIYRAENVKVFNGTLIGSRNDHDYGVFQGQRSTFGQNYNWASHEFGAGIWVASSKNVELYNLTVKEVTGDCIVMGYKSSNVTIRNSDISRARRGGIVAVDCDGLVIRGNRIHNIYNDVLHFDENGSVIGIGEEAGIAFEGDKQDERIYNSLIENNTIIGTDGDFTDNDTIANNSSSRLHWTISLSTGTNGVTIRNNDMTGGFRIASGSNILFEGNTHRNKRPEDASGYGRFMATYPVNRSTGDWRNSENVIIRNNKFHDIVIMINGGALTESRPDYRRNYAVVGNEFTMINHWRFPLNINTTVNTAVIDNTFHVDTDNWQNDWYNAVVGRRPEAYCFIGITARTPPQHDVDYNFYIANNKAGANTEHHYVKLYWVDGYDSYQGYGLGDRDPPEHEGLPEWYRESIDRREAVAFIDSFKWF